jgi:hypothetical protein
MRIRPLHMNSHLKGRPTEVMSFQGNALAVKTLRNRRSRSLFNPRESNGVRGKGFVEDGHARDHDDEGRGCEKESSDCSSHAGGHPQMPTLPSTSLWPSAL